MHSGRSPNALQPLIGMLLLGTEESQSEMKPPEECRLQVPCTSCFPLQIFTHWAAICQIITAYMISRARGNAWVISVKVLLSQLI